MENHLRPPTPPSASLSPTAAMPRLSFFARTSPTRVASPPLDPAARLFAGDVWVPAEPSFLPFGFGAKWTKTPLAVWTAPVVDARPLLHVRLGSRVAVIAAVPTPSKPASADKKQDKKPIVLDGKSPDDVRRAVLYHTAAVSAPLAFFVDSDAERDQLLALLRRAIASSPPHVIRPPSPSAPPPTVPTPTLDAAFALLQDARAKQRRGHVVDALAAFAAADRALAAVETSAPASDRARVSQARREARAAIDALEMEKALPRTVASLIPVADDSEPASSTSCVATPPPPAVSIDSRLEHLQAYAHQRDVDRAQRERRVAADDLTLRLHALRNDKPTTPEMESLRSRLDRLRGVDAMPTVVTRTQSLSPVDRIVQQAMDEVALGIRDDELQDEDDETVSSCSSRSSEEDVSSWRRR